MGDFLKPRLFLFWLLILLLVSCRHTPPKPPPPPPTFEYGVACQVRDDATHAPIGGATCMDGSKTCRTNDTDGYCYLGTFPGGVREVFAAKVGFDPNGTIYTNGDHNPPAIQVTLHAQWPQPQSFAPLVLEGDSGGYICHHDQIVSIPSGIDINTWRGDAWGVTISGLPFVSGGSSRHPERVLTWFFDRYSPTWQTEILNAYRRRGYTHFVLSWPDSRDGNGQSVAQFVDTAARVKAAIPFVAVFLTSKVYDAPNLDGATRLASIAPVLDALIASNAIDIGVVGWELDTFNEGQRLEDFIHLLHARYPQLPLWVHFTTYKTAWQPDGQPRAQFWASTAGELRGLLYQGNQNDSCGLMQAHFNDALTPAAGISAVGARVVAFELVAANEFDGDHPNEDDANARSWCVLNTPGPILASGFGNGGRFPNGNPTLRSY